MTVFKRIGLSVLVAVFGVFCLGLGEHVSKIGVVGFISPAEARVGRPLTPVSVAGVGRRTVRRCASGVYNC